MAELKAVTNYLDQLLQIPAYSHDASNNGLQFEGSREISKAVFAVDASNALFCIAADLDADFIFVHHGISWGSSLKRIVSLDAKRISLLAANSISLYGAHLPLDANPEIGHNALLADMLNLQNREGFGEYHGYTIGFSGNLEKPLSLKEIAAIYDQNLAGSGNIQIYGDALSKATKVAIISGGGAFPEAFAEAYEKGIDCYITGEMSHTAYHHALEAGVPVIALGHYRSETPGVLAVMEKIREQFNIETEFIDLPTNL